MPYSTATTEAPTVIHAHTPKTQAPSFVKGYLRSFVENVLEDISQYYFRVSTLHFEQLEDIEEDKRPVIFISNHASMSYPWDMLLLFVQLHQNETLAEVGSKIRPLLEQELMENEWINPFLLKDFWTKFGGLSDSSENLEEILTEEGAHVLYYPEGVEGIQKGFGNRYELQKFARSLVYLSIKHKIDIVPIATVNNEYLNPLNRRLERLNGLAKQLGISFMPISPLMLLMPYAPWLVYFALPSQLIYVMGSRIKPYKMLAKPFEEISEKEWNHLQHRVQMQMQIELDYAVSQYGNQPLSFPAYLNSLLSNTHKLNSFLPFTWPYLFGLQDSEYKNAQEQKEEWAVEETKDLTSSSFDKIVRDVKDAVNIAVNNPHILAFYLPVVGWLPLWLQGEKSSVEVR